MTNNEILHEFIRDYHDGMRLTVDQLKGVGKELDHRIDWMRFFGKIALVTGVIALFLPWFIHFQGASVFMVIFHSIISIPVFRKHSRGIKKLEIKDLIITELISEVISRHTHGTQTELR